MYPVSVFPTRVIETFGLDDGVAKNKYTPSESSPLVKDAYGPAVCGRFGYSSVVGMLLYISGHNCPDIANAVNCCASYMFCPKHSHEISLKRIGRYLKATRNRGLILDLCAESCKFDCYPDAYFSGMYGHEFPTDLACVKSRTGFIIKFANCPVYWVSKLQTTMALIRDRRSGSQL